MDRRSAASHPNHQHSSHRTIPLSRARVLALSNLASHPALAAFDKNAAPAPEAYHVVERYFRWAAQTLGINELNLDAENRELHRTGSGRSNGKKGRPSTVTELVLRDPLTVLKRFVAESSERPDYHRNDLIRDLAEIFSFYDWTRRARLSQFKAADAQGIAQDLPLTVTQPGRRRVIDIEPSGMQRLQTYHLITWAIRGIPVRVAAPLEFRYVPPQVPQRQDECELPQFARLSFGHLRTMRLRHFDRKSGLIYIPTASGSAEAAIEPTVDYTALLDTVLKLSGPLRRAAWRMGVEELQQTPLILAFDGGALAIDDRTPPSALKLRDELVDELIRNYRFSFEQVISFRRGDFNLSGNTLSLLDEERGTRCFKLSPDTGHALACWTKHLDSSCHAFIEKEAKKLLPLIAGGDGRHLTADPALRTVDDLLSVPRV